MRPTTREQFKEYCLRALGKGAINIEVTVDQIDDRIDAALLYYMDYHYDATEKVYYKQLITQTDKDNGYITVPENIIGAIRIFPYGNSNIATNMFDVRYQYALNDLYSFTSATLLPYVMTRNHLSLIEEVLIGQIPIDYNRHTNKIYIHGNWDYFAVGTYLIIEAYGVLDPDTYTDVWGDRWLARYCTALIKKQWGTNLSKYQNAVLPGGIQFDAQRILNEANAEIQQLEAEAIYTISLPPQPFML